MKGNGAFGVAVRSELTDSAAWGPVVVVHAINECPAIN